ncbi:MAG TPA: 6-phosphogluconolactonase [Polyangiaceae bacterium]|nr:6-phosphogluconolactonase [Polyangiaceae bacterium]
MERIVCDSKDLPVAAAARVADELTRAIAARGQASLALAGGTTPKATYEALAGLPLDWARIDVFFGDERCVPADHPDSNYRMAKAALFDRIAIPSERVHRMQGELADRDLAAKNYEAQLPERLDVVVLGIGEDAHTASLFPGAAALSEEVRRVLPVIGPKPPPERLSLTPPVLRAARLCLVLGSGAGKAEPVRRAFMDPLDVVATPIQLARDGVWFLDPAAASAL